MLAVTAAIKRSKSNSTTGSAFTSGEANRAKTGKPPVTDRRLNFYATLAQRVFVRRGQRRISWRCQGREVFPAGAHWLRPHQYPPDPVCWSARAPLRSQAPAESPFASSLFLQFHRR